MTAISDWKKLTKRRKKKQKFNDLASKVILAKGCLELKVLAGNLKNKKAPKKIGLKGRQIGVRSGELYWQGLRKGNLSILLVEKG